MKIIVNLVIVALALLAAQHLVPGITVSSFTTALIVAVVLGLLNLTIRPLLLLFTFPINILTFGLFTLVLNALMFYLAAAFVSGFEVSSFIAAFLGALLVSVIHFVADRILFRE